MAREISCLLKLLELLEAESTLYIEHKELAMLNELCKAAKPLSLKRLSSTRVIHVMLVTMDADHLWNAELAALANSCIAHHDLARLLLRQRKEFHTNTLRLLQAADSEAEDSDSSTLSQPDTERWRAFFSASGTFRFDSRAR